MGPIAARRLLDVVGNLEHVVAIEVLCAAQGIDERAPLTPGKGTFAAWQALRQVVPVLDSDRVLYPDIHAATRLLRSGELLTAVEAGLGQPLA
jgi:histidine ammonia-lyase